MLRRQISIFILALPGLTAGAGKCPAADPVAHVAYPVMTFLSFPQGPRNIAMGQTGVPDDASPSNVFCNPANIALFDRVYWNADFLDWPIDINFFDIGVFGGHAFHRTRDRALYVASAVRYVRMDFDAAEGRTIFLPEGEAGEFDAAGWAVPLSLAVGYTTRGIDVGHRGDEPPFPGDYWGVGLSASIGPVVLFADYARSSTSLPFTDETPQCFGFSGSYRY